MIEPLRRAHRRAWLALLVLLPLIGLLALGVHHPPALESSPPAGFPTETASPSAPGALALEWESDRLLARLSRNAEPVPDPLLYVEGTAQAPAAPLSPDARLVGRLVPGQPLDAGSPPDSVRLVLYSLAWDSVLVRLPVPERP